MRRSPGLGSRLRVRTSTIASWTALAVAVGSLAAYAIGAKGEPVHHAELNDGGVWISSQALNALQRDNRPLEQPDLQVQAASGDAPDVLQDGSAVVSLGAGGTATPVSTTMGAALNDGAVTVAGTPVLGGGSIATVDPASGKLWVTRVDPDVGVSSLAALDPNGRPVVTVGGDALVTVATDGTVLAVSGAKRTLTTLRPTGETFAEPVTSGLPVAPSGTLVAMTAVGDEPVLLDKQNDLIVGDHRVRLEAPSGSVPRLQQPGPAAADALVAIDGHLTAVSVGSGDTRDLVQQTGTPSAPVRLGLCIFSAWNQQGAGYISSVCDGQATPSTTQIPLDADAELVFRVNRSAILLNDQRNGKAWTVDSAKPVQIADWQALAPTKTQHDSDADQVTTTSAVKQPPRAKPDELGARPGRTTVLHVLDNDLVSGGGVLSIVGVDAPTEAGIKVGLAPDRESVLLTLAPSITRDLSFRYTISDGSGGKDATADGEVTVHVMSDGGSAQPQLRESPGPERTYAVTQGRSVEVPVTDDWRDPTYGDPVSLDQVTPPADVAATGTPEGLIRITPARSGHLTVPYAVSTGGRAISGSISLEVLPPTSTKPVAPVAQPDVAAGQVGGAIVIHPLDNDIPGADPTDPGAHLEIAGRVAPTSGLQVDSDLSAGTITVHATRAGSYTLRYAAGFGAAARSTSIIRVTVDPSSVASDLPIATPDQTTVRGTSPMVLDVLANDYDPKGQLLAVQHAEPADPSSPLSVAVIDGHWLRISATTTDMQPRTQAVSYTVSNGENAVTGTVTVTQKEPLPAEVNHPIAGADSAVVRSAGTVVVPVLDNDSTPSGDPVGLRMPHVAGLPSGQVQADIGTAYVSGNDIRYVAPAVTSPTTATVTYTVENTADPERPEAAGVLTVDITPPPSDQSPNRPPTPREIDARVVEGDAVSLHLPLVGNDPDGDSVSIVGVSSAPLHGRILAVGADTLSYQSFPGSPGTDEFGYTATDAYGTVAQGTVRVAVVPPGAPQSPVAVDDHVTADLGRRVDVDVLANDLRTPGTEVRIEPLGVAGAELVSSTGPIRLTSSADPKRPVVVPYRITNGIAESTGQLTVVSEPGYDNPPVLQDGYAHPTADSASTTVDVLAKAYDIDSSGAPLRVSSVGDAKAVIDGGNVTLPVLDVPQVVPFEVTDDGGATAAAAIYVPARPAGAPYVRPGVQLSIDPGETKEFPLSDVVADPEGDHVVLTLEDRITGAPSSQLRAGTPKGEGDVLQLTAGRQPGPGAVTFEVSDRGSLTDETAHVVTLTVPVQIGEPSPRLTCPSDPLTVYTGGASQVIDVASVCHVWTADPAAAARLGYTASWASGQQPSGVTVTSTRSGIQLKAAIDATAGATGVLDVAAEGSESTAQLPVRVLAAPPPSLAGIALSAEAGKPVTVDLTKYASSPFGSGATWVLTAAPQQLSGPVKATVSVKGTTVTITPPGDASASGNYAFRVTLSDSGKAAGATRPTASTTIAITVVAPPGVPTNVHSDGQTYDGRVVLLWTPPSSNGGTISGYKVSWHRGTQTCPSSPCPIKGLKNGQTYSFTVVAHNQYGDSARSAPGSGKPDRVPDPVTGLVVAKQEDRSVTLRWSDPADLDYSPLRRFYVSYPGGGVTPVPAAQHTYTATGLTNGDNVDFAVWADNDAGPSQQKATVSGMAAGKPEAPTMAAPETSNVAGGERKAAAISWHAVGANGPDPVTYQVTRTGGGSSKVLCAWQVDTTCEDDLSTDGTKYSYTVQARNGEATAPRESNAALHVSASSAAVTVEAASTPENVRIASFAPTGEDRQAKVIFDVGASHGATNRIECDPTCPGVSTVANAGRAGVTATIGGYTNGSTATIRIRSCNGSSASAQTGSDCSAWVSETTTTYGAIGQPSLSVGGSGQAINWSYSGTANGRPVKVTLSMGGSVIDSFTSGDGTYSRSGQQSVGYSTTKSFSLTVSDSTSTPNGARASKSDSGSATTPDEPPALSVGRGASDNSVSTCTSGCYRVRATTAHFSGTVTCRITGAYPDTVGFVTWTQGPNETKDSPNVYGYPGRSITINCTDGRHSVDATDPSW